MIMPFQNAPAALVVAFAGAPGVAQDKPHDTRALVAEIMADAESRSSLLASSPLYHDGKNFAIHSDDDAFKLLLRGQIQFRYILNMREESSTADLADDEFETGFQTRRTKFGLDGHVMDSSLTFKLLAAASRSSGDFALEEAFVRKEWENGLSLQFGQQRLPFAREELISSSLQLAVERTLINQIFGQEFSQAIMLGWSGERIRIHGAFSDGIASRNSEFGEPKRITLSGFPNSPIRGESDYALTGRAEWLAKGSWNQFRDFTSPQGSEFGLMLGAAAHVEGGDASSSTFSDGSYRYTAWTADLSLEGDGWNAFLAGYGASSDYNAAPTGNNDDFALFLQGGIMIPETRWEPYARLELLFPDNDRENSHDSIPILTCGANWYVHGHAAKFTFDVVWLMEETSSLTIPRPALGMIGGDDADELIVRIQWQILF